MIEVLNVSFSYKPRRTLLRSSKAKSPVHVLKGIEMTIPAGQLFGLIGPNGSGKTTLAKLILGAYQPDSGILLVDGEPRPGLGNSRWKQRIGWLSGASSRLFSTITLLEHIAMYNSLYKHFDKQWFDGIIEEMDLADKLHKLPTALSFGERIKFEIAITMAYRPEILVLDEPTVGLDPLAIRHVRQLIQTYMSRQNVCGLLTSHNLKDIEELCPQGAFLHDGILMNHFYSEDSWNAERLEARYREVYSHEA